MAAMVRGGVFLFAAASPLGRGMMKTMGIVRYNAHEVSVHCSLGKPPRYSMAGYSPLSTTVTNGFIYMDGDYVLLRLPQNRAYGIEIEDEVSQLWRY
jgi:hypothetical protein